MSVDYGLAGRVAIVTGGSVGIGKETARQLARQGAKVVIAARTRDALEAAAEALRAETGGEIVAVPVDTTLRASVENLVSETVRRFGGVHILVNCAAAPGGLVRNEIEKADEDGLIADLNTKLVGYFRMCKACVPHMRQARWGRIVNVGGLTARSTEALSGMRNAALVHLTKTLSDQLGVDGITVNIVHPGVTRTEHIEAWFADMARAEGTSVDAIIKREAADPAAIRRMLEADEVANAIVFLASSLASGLTGESIAVDGGLSRAVFL
ncbi:MULTISPECIES: SDR family NAD(P)-dependent oxidoreductase [Nitrospirillum]|uniref:Short-chain dehydrogenase n=1 Tax=Nitrospirillum viridazoti CBAmc TaxID=1441467 RepID=A0A248JUQ0_9PROT|nr:MULTISPECIES: SDR family oxidoreductase [Nitrospirillum]ASG22329.1 short-chain dehydrogenase [Nitrospirillum amazonense CBAmc]MEA1674618.1 SDR family oxidoreductase [Nitrospirillum sp. BR 11163]TWB43141.1 NAD(P)-dependent dehydrogenase (short-subunit alcohol dehydrogenase family) [Nitrospirillum amazonense]